MSFPFTNNRFLPVNIKGDDNIASDLNGNVSLLCNGKTSLYGDTTISAGKVLAIGKSPSSSTYPLDVSGNINYSGSLFKNGVIQNIALLNGNQTWSGINSFQGPFYIRAYYPTEALQNLITATGALTSYSGTNLIYSVNTVEAAADTTITLPSISGTTTGSYSVGIRITFIRSIANSTFNVSFIGSSGQSVYGTNNIGGTTAQNLMPSGSLRCSFVSARDTATTFGWFQIDTDFVDVRSNQTIGGLKVFSSLTEQAVNSSIRSNWATGGTLSKLNRNISEILTPLNYDLTTKVFGIYDEVNDRMFSVDLSGSQLISQALTNNFFYEIAGGRSVTVDYDVNVGRDLKLSNQTLGGVIRNVIIDPANNRILQVTAGNEVSLGRNALSLSTGTENIAIGNLAGSTNTTGIRNIFISPNAPQGTVQTGTNCTYIGYNTGNSGVGNWVNSTALGTGSLITASNQISLGVNTSTIIARGIFQSAGSISMGSGQFTTPFAIPLEASPNVITASISLAAVGNFNQYTIVPAAATPMTITLAGITTAGNHKIGLRITFTRGIGGANSTISFIGANTTQPVYDINGVNIGGATVAQALMPPEIKQITLQGVRPTATTLGWMVVSVNGIDFSSDQIITGAKTFTTGGLTISPATNLNLNGDIVANALTVTPTQLSFLNVVSGNQIPYTSVSGTPSLSNLVTLSTAQTITSAKTISDTGSIEIRGQIVHGVSPTLITATTQLLGSGLFEYYSVSAGGTAYTIELPIIEAVPSGGSLAPGARFTFRRVGGTTTTLISFRGLLGGQSVFNTVNAGGTSAQPLMGSGVYIVRLVAMVTATAGLYAWFQV